MEAEHLSRSLCNASSMPTSEYKFFSHPHMHTEIPVKLFYYTTIGSLPNESHSTMPYKTCRFPENLKDTLIQLKQGI